MKIKKMEGFEPLFNLDDFTETEIEHITVKVSSIKKEKTAPYIPQFIDEQWLTAKEKMSVYKEFKRTIESRDMSKMLKAMYNHCHVHCGFIAHYNINGFRDEYSSPLDFLRFVEHFAKPDFMLKHSRFQDINAELIKIAQQHYEKIKQEMDENQKNNDLLRIQLLAKKHNLAVTLQ